MTTRAKSIPALPRVRLQLTMYFAYQGRQRPDYAAYTTTFEAGKRTATLRKKEWYKKTPWRYQALFRLQPGDLLAIWSGKVVGQGERLIVKVLQQPVELVGNLTDDRLEDLSQCEEWTVDYLKHNGYQPPQGCIQLRYTVV